MSANVVSLFSRPRRVVDWGQQELAEFYRVREVLAKSGIALDADQGLSDEGDPWFVFCRSDTGDVVVHFARTDDLYIIGIPALGDRVLRGFDFRSMIDSFLSGQINVVVVPQSSEKVRRLVIHPNALMVAFVATILLLTDGVKGSTAAAEATTEQSLAPSSFNRLPFFEWAHYQRLVGRDGACESERTLALVAASVVASIVANDFDLFDNANEALGSQQLSVLEAASEQGRLGEDAQPGRIHSIAYATDDISVAVNDVQPAHPSQEHGNPLQALAETDLAQMVSIESNVAIDFTDFHIVDFSVSDKAPGIVEQMLRFFGSMTEASAGSADHILKLTLSLINDLIDSTHNLRAEVAPAEFLAILNGVIESAALVPAGSPDASSYVLDPGAVVIEMSGASTVDTATLFIPESSASLGLTIPESSASLEPTGTTVASPPVATSSIDEDSSGTIPVVSMSRPVVDNMLPILQALRTFLTVAEDVDVVVDSDTIVFVDRSDKDSGVALQVGSAWTMQNDITIMIVGSSDTIHAYHDIGAPIA